MNEEGSKDKDESKEEKKIGLGILKDTSMWVKI